MKKRILSFLLILVMAVGFLPTLYVANAATHDNLTYEIADGEVTITGCEYSATEVTIPSEIEGYPVTTIGHRAFFWCDSLESLTIPDSVTSIGDRAFSNCYSLEEICVGENNLNFTVSNGVLYNKSKTELICCPVGKSGDYIIPDSVTTIGDCAFSDCKSIESITIPDSVTTIGDYAFYNCSSLTSVMIPNEVTSINGGTFFKCKSLASITIPDSVTTIGNEAFADCCNLESIEIGEGVTTIGDYAFYNCSSLTSVTIPNGVTTIGSGAFVACDNLASITIPDSVTTIGDRAFWSCDGLISITIPDSVTIIGEKAFDGCGITNAVIGNNVTTIVYGTFASCTNLASVTLPNSVTTIDEYAFSDCDSLSNVNYGGSEADRGNMNIKEEGNTYLFNATWNYHEHKYDNACDMDCNTCGKTRTITHTFGAYASDNNATTEKDGTKTRTCSVCGTKDTVTDVGSKLPIPEPSPTPEQKPIEIVDTTKVFTDVKAKKWYTNAVNYAYSHGFIAGVSDTEFGRDVPVTRGMFITILARIAGVDTSSKANKVTTKFTDVKSGKYYTNAIKWASENGVVKGITDTTFGPNAAIERQQLCTMIVNFAKYMKIDLKASQDEIKFTDASAIRKYAKTAVATCQKAGIVSGYATDGGTEFKPQNTATRAEAAQILYKFHKDFVA